MNPNKGLPSKIAYAPTGVDMRRSVFPRNHTHTTTMPTGKLVPLYWDEILPGDTVSLDLASIIRGSTPVYPVMDEAYFDLFAFFVPARLTWDHWKEFMGESPSSPWINPVEYEVPFVGPTSAEQTRFFTVSDYMGVPPVGDVGQLNALPFRAFALIWNEWFRDQNTMDAIFVDTGDSSHWLCGSPNEVQDYVHTAALGGILPPVCKLPDYFTTCLPEPQKGPDVLLPLGDSAPVVFDENVAYTEDHVPTFPDQSSSASNTNPAELTIGTGDKLYRPAFQSDDGKNVHIDLNGSHYADLSSATSATINQLRLAFQIQKMYERDARSGTRYREILYAHFGVQSPDATQQVPEYLGGKRVPINVKQVVQTSSTDDVSPQGNTAAVSLTAVREDGLIVKSFTEHGFIFVVGCVRTAHTYQQGLDRSWLRRRRFDYYDPLFANIGNQPVYNAEIYANKPSAHDSVFGYQEAWADYRYKQNRVSGALRSDYAESLDAWTYADDFANLPKLSAEFIAETDQNVERTLAVQGKPNEQWIVDLYFKATFSRVMPLYSVPGLIDHH